MLWHKLSSRQQKQANQAGFTLIELMVVVAIGLILFGLISINLGQTRSTGSVVGTVDTLLSDIKHQQIQAMVGDIGSVTSQQPQGLLLQTASYTLFAGSSYSAGDSNNFVVNLPANITLSSTFGSNTLQFTKGTGQVQSFASGSNTITVSGIGVTKTITVGRFGALSVN